MLERVLSRLMQERMLPALAWSISALAVAAGFAVHELHSVWKVNWAMVGIVVLSCALLQVVVGEWLGGRGKEGLPVADADASAAVGRRTGEAGGPVTDAWQAMEHSVLAPEQARMMRRLLGCLGVVSLGVYAARDLQSSLWLCALVGLWAALAYASHSFSRVPVLTEWLTVFPAMVACTLGTYFVLSDGWEPILAWGAGLHALLSLAWLMQMHLRDVVASEGTRTTVSWVARRFGLEATRQVPAAYFLVAAFLGTVATLHVAHVFVLTVLCSLLGAISAWNADLGNVKKMTELYRKMIVMTMAHGVMVALWVAWM